MPKEPSDPFEMWGANEVRAVQHTIREQRAQRPMYIEHLAQAMVRGEWRRSNDAVAFIGHRNDPDFRNANGQHRLLAILRADELSPGIKVPLLVVYGLNDSDAETFDQGRIRTLADTLDFLEGPTESPGHRTVAMCVSLGWHVEAGTWASRTPTPTRSQQLTFLKQHADLIDAIEPALFIHRELGGPLAGYAVGIWLASYGQHVDQLDTFVNEVALGEMLKAQDPAYQLRKAINQVRNGEVSPSGEKGVRSWWIAGMFIRAWNAYVAGERTARLALMRRTDTFPEAA